MADEQGPLALPERWVHADAPPSWSELADAAVLFVRWRLDRWPTLERLHELDQGAREADGAALVLGLHGPAPDTATPDRVRDVLLARGTFAPTGVLDEGGTAPVDVGGAALVTGGEVVEAFAPDADTAAVAERLHAEAPPGSASWRPRGAAPGPWPLAFPTDVAVGGSRIAVADTGHNRVLVARPGGEILHLVGDGVPDDRDGSLAEARFEAPRGVCWRGEELLVADTGNDVVRSVRPAADEVTTLARGPEGSLPAGLACPEDGPPVVALAGRGCLARLEDGGLAPLGEATEAHPVDVVRHEAGWLASELAGARLEHVDAGGDHHTVWEGDPLVEPSGLLGGEATVVADPGSGELVELRPDEGTSGTLVAPGSGLEAPAAVDREAEQLVVADGGGHHLWRVDTDGAGDPSPTRVRLTESPLSLAEHIRLDPVEIAPGGRLELSIAYLGTEDDRLLEDPQAPTTQGPVRMEDGSGPTREDGRLRVDLEGEVAASGSLRIRWSLTREELGHEAAWDLPIVVRPGAEDRLRLALSTSSP